MLKKLQTGGDFLKAPPENMQQVQRVVTDPDTQGVGLMKGWLEWWRALQAVGSAFAGEAAPQQALRDAVAAADAVLARQGPQR